MPRPQRIEYEHACYHVMNRGRGRKPIFHGQIYYEMFLSSLAEAHNRFQCIIHAYCLMGNHYHLLLETPKANLGRVMRHINGVYTQRHNRLKNTDGPLFRGRYKAVLVDADGYLLRLTRYIHRNPIDTKVPAVEQLSDYPWSSYPAYTGAVKPPSWLNREQTYTMLGKKQRYAGYAAYVKQGTDEETATFYQKGNMASIMGDQEFREFVFSELLPTLESEQKVKVVRPDIALDEITAAVAHGYGVMANDLQKVVKGPQKDRESRKVAMYLCQELAGAKLIDIASHFNLGNIGSVSFITHQVRKRRREDKNFNQKTERLIKSIIKQVD